MSLGEVGEHRGGQPVVRAILPFPVASSTEKPVKETVWNESSSVPRFYAAFLKAERRAESAVVLLPKLFPIFFFFFPSLCWQIPLSLSPLRLPSRPSPCRCPRRKAPSGDEGDGGSVPWADGFREGGCRKNPLFFAHPEVAAAGPFPPLGGTGSTALPAPGRDAPELWKGGGGGNNHFSEVTA